MPFRFFRRLKLAPGISINLSKSGPSLSIGPRGAKFTIGPHGTRTTLGIPGTGLSYSTTQSAGHRTARAQNTQTQAEIPAPAPTTVSDDPVPHLNLSFFEKLTTAPEEQQFVDGLREIHAGNNDAALSHFVGASHLADGSFMAGWMFLKNQDLDNAEQYLRVAIEKESEIGQIFSKFALALDINIAIADELMVYLTATPTAARIAMVEVYQRQRRWNEAINILKELYQQHPEDPVIRLSVVELIMHAKPDDSDAAKRVVNMAEGITNDSPIHAAILLYKCRALRVLKMPTAAIEGLTDTLRKKKDYPEHLLLALRYERALAYQDAGNTVRYRAELEKLYADSPEYDDVAQRLGVK